MSRRSGFGDEIWRLAREGDVAALDRAAELLLGEESGAEYDGRRARAFGFALGRRTRDALVELNEGWSDDWPPPSVYALDVARVHFLAGDSGHALAALQLEARSFSHWEGIDSLVAACVRRQPGLWRRALRLVLSTESGLARPRAVAAVLRARLRASEPDPVAVPGATPGS